MRTGGKQNGSAGIKSPSKVWSAFHWTVCILICVGHFKVDTVVKAFSTNARSRLVHHHQRSNVMIRANAPRRSTTSSHQKTKYTSKRRKKDVDSIIASIGLQPVTESRKRNKQTKEWPKVGDLVKSASEIEIATQLDYSRNGHAVLRGFVDASALKNIRKELQSLMAEEELSAWRQKVQVASNSPELASSCQSVAECQKEMENLGVAASLPFLQYFNTWRKLESVKTLAYALAEAASVLLDVPEVRLYQDSVFWKRVGDGPTPWHADARMAPFDTAHFITFWIPLQNVPRNGTALLFCSKSHSDFALPYWNPIDSEKDANSEWNRLEHRYPKNPVHYMPMKLSDLTVHSGWTLHCADGANEDGMDRMALAISYVDANAQVRPDALDYEGGVGDNEDRWSYQDWAYTIQPRRPFLHPLVPIVWPAK